MLVSEEMNLLASFLAAVEIGRAKNRADILNDIIEARREKDASSDCDSETTHRLLEKECGWTSALCRQPDETSKPT